MSTPKASIPNTAEELYTAIGHRLHEQTMAAIPDHVRSLLPEQIAGKVNDKVAIATTNEWRDQYNLSLNRLAKLASEALKDFKANKPQALQSFRRKLIGGEYSDVDRFLSANDVPQKYLMELIATYIDDAKQFPKLLELLVKLGKGRV